MNSKKVIQKAAFEMFRDWTKIAQEKYPKMDFTIIDETELVNDTKKCLNDALYSLFEKDHDEDRQIEGWSIGFVKGFIKGCLSVKWFFEYYQKQSDNYRNIIAVKSIIEFFKVDSNFSWRLDAIYKEFFKSVNLENIEFRTKIDVDFFNKYALTPELYKGIVAQILDNMVVMFLQTISKETAFNLPEKDYFTNEEIHFFIEEHLSASLP